MSQLRKSSLLFDKVRQGANTVAAKSNKSSFVYEADKTWTQRLLDKNVKKLQENQKFYSVRYVLLFFMFSFDLVSNRPVCVCV